MVLAVLPACGSEMLHNDDWQEGMSSERDIVTVAFRDRLLIVHTGGRYTLLDTTDDTVLADRVSEDELSEIAPDVASFYRDMAAGAVIDASVDPELMQTGPDFER
jgi:hypothetical protein